MERDESHTALADGGFWKMGGQTSSRFTPLRDYLRRRTDLPPREAISATLEDMESLSSIRLDGMKVILAIGPAGAADFAQTGGGGNKTLTLPHLALINLSGFLRSYGARVGIRDHFVGNHFNVAERLVVSDVARLRRRLEGASDPELDSLISRWAGLLSLEGADLLGFSSANEADPLTFVLLKRHLLSVGNRIPVVVGGYWGFPEARDWVSELDVLVQGEGEVPLLLVCDSLCRGEPTLWIPGVAIVEGGRIDSTEVAHSMNVMAEPSLDGFPLDAYSYETYARFQGLTIPYQISVGCPYNCAYCNNAHKRQYKVREPARVIRDLQRMNRDHGVTQLFLLDSAFNCERRFAEEVLEGLIATGIEWRWCDCARPNLIGPEMLARMRRSGCEWLNWGFDTLSNRLSSLYGRHVDAEHFGRVLRDSAAAGIRNSVNIVVGMPHETEADFQELLDFIDEHHQAIHWLFFLNYNFIPHSDIGRYPARYGLVPSADGSGVDEIGGLTWRERQAEGVATLNKLRAVLMDRYGYC